MAKLIAFLALVTLLVIVIAFSVGWMTFQRTPEKATIEIKTQQIERAGEQAVESGKEIIKDAARSVEEALGNDRQDNDPQDKATSASEAQEPRTDAPGQRETIQPEAERASRL